MRQPGPTVHRDNGKCRSAAAQSLVSDVHLLAMRHAVGMRDGLGVQSCAKRRKQDYRHKFHTEYCISSLPEWDQ